jgi:hypothetical protein
MLLPLALLASGCVEASDGPVPSSVLEACLHVGDPQEQVFRNAADWERFYADHKEGGAAPPVDFGRAVLAARFDGAGSACVSLTLDTVAVREGTVIIDATRHTSPDPCVGVVAYPQLLVVVERRDTPVVFRIRDVTGALPAGHAPCL